MKEPNVLNVLMYLFQNHMGEDPRAEIEDNALIGKLETLGFKKVVVQQAFNWLANLKTNHENSLDAPSSNGIRVYSEYECKLINSRCRGLLHALEQQNILKPTTREMVISQLLQLEDEGIDPGLIKWVTLMVLYNQPDESEALATMEFLVLDDIVGEIH